VNMASKLASRTIDGEMLVSERFYASITDNYARYSCGCQNGQETSTKAHLWTQVDVSVDPKFDFKSAYCLKSYWCPKHGNEYCERLLKLDQK